MKINFKKTSMRRLGTILTNSRITSCFIFFTFDPNRTFQGLIKISLLLWTWLKTRPTLTQNGKANLVYINACDVYD